MIANDFTPGGPARHQLKDTSTAVALARELGLALPVTGWWTGCSTTWWRTATATSTTARSSASCAAATGCRS